MGLLVTRISVKGFRSYEDFSFEPDAQLTVLAGPNAAGKTNLIEGIQLLTEATSFRNPAWADTVKKGLGQAQLRLEAEGDNRRLQIDLTITEKGRRLYEVNGKARRTITQVAGIMPCVVFTPDDLRMVKDSAERRRAALDSLGAQLSPTFSRIRTDYEKILRHRNSLLRDGATDEATLEPWTARLIDVGGLLVTHRHRLFDRLSRAMKRIYSELADDGALETQYIPSWERDGVVADSLEPHEAMRRHLQAKRAAEFSRRSTISGPHRDEMIFLIGGEDARTFGSQGQQRTVALAWKLAEVEVVTEIASQRPVLLLDDVMSELDERRRHALASFAGSVAQTIMTTTNLGYFEAGLLSRAKVVSLP